MTSRDFVWKKSKCVYTGVGCRPTRGVYRDFVCHRRRPIVNCDENGLSIEIERDYPHPLLILGTIASNVKKKEKKASILHMIQWFTDLIYVTSHRYPYFFSVSPFHSFVLYNTKKYLIKWKIKLQSPIPGGFLFYTKFAVENKANYLVFRVKRVPRKIFGVYPLLHQNIRFYSDAFRNSLPCGLVDSRQTCVIL